MASTKTLEERKNDFIKKLKLLYPDYTLISEYKDSKTKVTLKHKKGYIWNIEPRHLDGKRQCSQVAMQNKKEKGLSNKKLSHNEFLNCFYNKWSKEEYEVIGTYINNETNIEIKHKKCGRIFKSTPKNLLYHNKKGCTYCYSKTAKTVDKINNEIKENNIGEYECIKTEIINGHSYGTFIHKCDICENHVFKMRVSDMLSKHKQRCPKCNIILKESKAVKDIKNYLDENNITYEQEVRYETCKNKAVLPFDFYLKDYDLLIEYDGIQHYKSIKYFGGEESLKIRKINDSIKNEWCKNNNKELLRINYKQDHLKVLDNYLKINYKWLK